MVTTTVWGDLLASPLCVHDYRTKLCQCQHWHSWEHKTSVRRWENPDITKYKHVEPHNTSSMSKESAFSVRSWASLGGARVGGGFSGVESRFFSSSSFTTWVFSTVLWLVDWTSADAVWGCPLAAGSALLCSGLFEDKVLKSQTKINLEVAAKSSTWSGNNTESCKYNQKELTRVLSIH